ncbi:unnamed protein product, partial [Ectocarpus sp. 12 AP-2014]
GACSAWGGGGASGGAATPGAAGGVLLSGVPPAPHGVPWAPANGPTRRTPRFKAGKSEEWCRNDATNGSHVSWPAGAAAFEEEAKGTFSLLAGEREGALYFPSIVGGGKWDNREAWGDIVRGREEHHAHVYVLA